MERLDMIVEEVLRRLRLLLDRKRILVILRDHSDFSKILSLVGDLKEKGYSFSLLSLLSKDVSVLDIPEFSAMERVRSGSFREEEYEQFIRGFEGLMVSDLRLEELKSFSELLFQETLGKLVFHSIREDKPVYALSRDMTRVKNPHLEKRLGKIREELYKLKIHVVMGSIKEGDSNPLKVKEAESLETGNSNGSAHEEKILMSRFITLADAVSALGNGKDSKKLRISTSSRLTMEAEDYLRRQGVDIQRV